MTTKPFDHSALARLHDVMAGYVARGQVPGVVTLVSRRGQRHVNAVGTLALDGASPVQHDTIFRISSMTKPVIAAAALMLVDEGRLALDEPVDRLLPELANRRVLRRIDGPLEDTVPAQRPITVRDVLTSRSGHGMVFDPPSSPIMQAMDELALGQGPPAPQTPPPPDEWMRRLGTLPLIHQPGERWLYNTGGDVLGVLVARASGQELEAFLRGRLFEPLGMHDTGFSVPPNKINRLATAYGTDAGSGQLMVYDAAQGGQWSRPPAFPSGAGGLVSTVDDYGAFAQMLLNRGEYQGTRILSRALVEEMTTNQLTPEQQAGGRDILDESGWGFGVSVTIHADALSATPGRYGWAGGLGTSWLNDPNEDLIGIQFTQAAWTSAGPPPICTEFWQLVYQALAD